MSSTNTAGVIEDLREHFDAASKFAVEDALDMVEGLPTLGHRRIARLEDFAVAVAESVELGPLIPHAKKTFDEYGQEARRRFIETRKDLQFVRSLFRIVRKEEEATLHLVTRQAGKVKDFPTNRRKQEKLEYYLGAMKQESTASDLLRGNSLASKGQVRKRITTRYESVLFVAEAGNSKKKTRRAHDARRDIRDLSALCGAESFLDHEQSGPTWGLFVVLNAIHRPYGKVLDVAQTEDHAKVKAGPRATTLALELQAVMPAHSVAAF